jgi:hypothetical protein
MLCGIPPFVGANAEQVAALHLTEAPRPLRGIRPTAPAGVQRVLDRLLAKSPADRLQTADDLVRLLTGSITPVPPSRISSRVRRWAIPAVVAAAILVAAGVWYWRRPPPADPEQFVVLPFRHRGSAAPRLIDGDMCESLIYEALGRWRDLSVTNSLVVRDAIDRQGGQVTSLSSGLRLARGLQAGRLVWGEVWENGDTTFVRAVLYDTRDGQVVHQYTTRMQEGDAAAGFAALTDTLVVRSAGSGSLVPGTAGTQSFAALREYARSHAALARWDLTEAASRLRAALAADPVYPQAHLRLAQIAQWEGRSPRMWREDAAAAVAGGRLSSRDSVLALALLDLADRRFQDGCQRYRALTLRDSLDFAAWYGLGECQSRNRAVLRDSASPSGWSFASSGQAAVEAYVRALSLIPSVHIVYQGATLGRLQELLYVDPELVRPGQAVEGADTVRFAAFAGLDADTLTFIPWPAADLFAGRPEALPETRAQALRWTRELLRRLAETWVRAYPRSLRALELYVIALELNGELSGNARGLPTVIDAVRQMRALAPNDMYRRDAMLWEARIRVKQGQFALAGALADSLLRGLDRDHPEAHRFAPAAALTGRVQLAADLLAGGAPIWIPVDPDTREVELPVPVREDALRLLAFASFGAADSVPAVASRIRSSVSAYVVPAEQPAAMAALLDRPTALAFPLLSHSGGSTDYLLELQQQVRQGQRAAVRNRLDAIAALRKGQRPGDMALEITLAEARLRLAVGDSAGTAAQLDQALEALPTFGVGLLREVPPAAALGRTMALRAELAAAAGDRALAARWARAVMTLWSDADPPLAPTLARMRQLGGRD